MKRLFFSVFLLFFHAANLKAQDLPDDFSILKGNISSLVEKNYQNPLHPGAKKGQISSVYEFTNGRVSRKKLYYGNHLDNIERYEYNEFGLVDKEIAEFSSHPEAINFAIKHSYIYDSLSRIKQELAYHHDGKPFYKKDSIRYDEGGNLIAYSFTLFPYQSELELDTSKRVHLFKYDTLNRMVSLIIQSNYMETQEASYSYDKSGNIISEVSFGEFIGNPRQEKIDVKYSYIFDKRGNWIKKYLHYKGKKYLHQSRSIKYK
jgi:hypothetical protein